MTAVNNASATTSGKCKLPPWQVRDIVASSNLAPVASDPDSCSKRPGQLISQSCRNRCHRLHGPSQGRSFMPSKRIRILWLSASSYMANCPPHSCVTRAQLPYKGIHDDVHAAGVIGDGHHGRSRRVVESDDFCGANAAKVQAGHASEAPGCACYLKCDSGMTMLL